MGIEGHPKAHSTSKMADKIEEIVKTTPCIKKCIHISNSGCPCCRREIHATLCITECMNSPWLELEVFILQHVSQAADLLPSAVRCGNVPAEFGKVDGTRVPQGNVGVDVHARGLYQLGHCLATRAGIADLDQHLVVKQTLQALCKA